MFFQEKIKMQMIEVIQISQNNRIMVYDLGARLFLKIRVAYFYYYDIFCLRGEAKFYYKLTFSEEVIK